MSNSIVTGITNMKGNPIRIGSKVSFTTACGTPILGTVTRLCEDGNVFVMEDDGGTSIKNPRYLDLVEIPEERPYLVDIPDEYATPGDECWKNIGEFKTKAEAVAWIREHIGNCDDEGNICLISHCPQN